VVKGLLARTGRKREAFFIPIAMIDALERGGAKTSSYKLDVAPYERREGEILVTRDLWDKQVIDLERRRVVRVNDAVISEAHREEGGKRWWVRGVDVGMGGLLRRLKLGRLAASISSKLMRPYIVRWQHMDVFGSNVPGGVPVQHNKLAALHPVEIARISDSVSYHQGAEIIASLDDTLAADTLEEIVTERQTDIMENIPEERAAHILEAMAPDEATDLLSELPEARAASLLREMDEDEAQDVRRLMRYPEHSAGGRMTTDFVRTVPSMTVREVIEANKPIFLTADLIYYIYVVDSEETNILEGIITVRDLLVHDPDKPVGDFMLRDVIAVRPAENEREVARLLAEYNLLAVPVVDRNRTLLGVVTVDDALDALLPEGWKKRLPRIFS
jgi:magnesium transporter